MSIVELSRVLIRLANSQDRQEIVRLEKLAVKNLCQNIYDERQIDTVTERIEHLRFNDEIVFVAEQNDNLVGFVSLLSYRKILRTLYVRQNLQDKGIGARLLKAIEQEAVKQKISTLKVTSSLAERSFYNAQGYQEIAFCQLGKMDLLIPCIAMQKKLSNSFQLQGNWSFLCKMTTAILPNALFLLAL